jgi:hypothetical protein
MKSALLKYSTATFDVKEGAWSVRMSDRKSPFVSYVFFLLMQDRAHLLQIVAGFRAIRTNSATLRIEDYLQLAAVNFIRQSLRR